MKRDNGRNEIRIEHKINGDIEDRAGHGNVLLTLLERLQIGCQRNLMKANLEA